MNSKERHEARYKRRVARRKLKREQVLKGVDSLELLFDFDNLIVAFNQCKKGVSWKYSVQYYGIHLFENIYKTINKVFKGEAITKGFVEFTINERGKQRHIKSVHISERVVQKLVCMFFLTKAIDRTLIYDNSASTKGKGTHFCLRRLKCHLQKFYRKHGNNGFIAIYDIKGFFDNIRHIENYKKLKAICDDGRIVEVIMQFVDAFNPLFYDRTSKRKLNKLQKFKRRLNGKSMGLGSEVSQTFAKAYTNEIDHYMKEVLGLKFFAHYMDDFYIIHHSKKFLLKCTEIFKKLLADIGLQLNESKCRIVKLRSTFVFLKVRFNLLDSGKILRRVSRQSITRMRRKLKRLHRLLEKGVVDFATIRSAYESWKGYIGRPDSKKHNNRCFKLHSCNCKRNMDKLFNELFIDGWHYNVQFN